MGHFIPNTAYIFMPIFNLNRRGTELYFSLEERMGPSSQMIGELDYFYANYVFLDEHMLFLFDKFHKMMFHFNMTTGIWTQFGKGRYDCPLFDVVKLGKLIFVTTKHTVGKVDCYNIETDTWSNVPKHPSIIWDRSAVVNRVLYVLGCKKTQYDMRMHAISYFPPYQSWNFIRQPLTQRCGFALVAYHGRLYIIGGYNTKGPLQTVEEYDPDTGIWCLFHSLPRPVMYPRASVMGEYLVVYDNSGPRRNIAHHKLTMFYTPDNMEWRYASFDSNLLYVQDYITISITDPEVIRDVKNHAQMIESLRNS